jgi:uncharacterized Fe-S cluster protein YjdI
MPPQAYHGTNVTIFYDEAICKHAGQCVKTLPSVFDVSRTPWIDPDRATPREIREAIAKCPTGALKMTER